MRSSMQEQIKDCFKYPYLGILNLTAGEVVVLFYNPRYGTVIHTSRSETWVVGQVQSNWNEEDFVKFEGQIVLEN